MIRRGLQILGLVGITALGAAPCLAQSWPTTITLTGFTNNAWNGLYVAVGSITTSTDNQGLKFMKYDGATNSFWATFIQGIGSNGAEYFVGIHSAQPGSAHGEFRVARSAIYASPQIVYRNFLNNAGAVISGEGTPFGTGDSAYVTAFPDWAKAATLIPLGFTFAMAFWAAAVALTISLKWVRDIASAAS